MRPYRNDVRVEAIIAPRIMMRKVSRGARLQRRLDHTMSCGAAIFTPLHALFITQRDTVLSDNLQLQRAVRAASRDAAFAEVLIGKVGS
jgi:hypothetical protein